MSRRQNTTLLPQISAGSIPLCLPFFMSRRQNTTLLPQISAGSIPLCLLFSCPGVRILHFCHRFQLETSPYACFFHVPVSEHYASATHFSEQHPLVLAFFMSRHQNTTLLPQISASSIPLCLLFSCPGARTPPPATKKPRLRKSPKIPKAVAHIYHSPVTNRLKQVFHLLFKKASHT